LPLPLALVAVDEEEGGHSGGASGNYGAIGSNSQKRRELPAMLATTERSSRRSALIDYGKYSVPTTHLSVELM
jgi:hypothetical protein